MNQNLHRLVFSRRHGTLVAVAEHTHAGGKCASGEGGGTRMCMCMVGRLAGSAAALLASLVTVLLPAQQAFAQARAPLVFASRVAAPAANLPVPYGRSGTPVAPPRPFAYDPAKGSASADLEATGRVQWNVNGNKATFNQGSEARVVINWDSFNIGAGYKVHFAQDKDPAKYVSALNRIWGADPSLILGALTADREVILLNANGVYFGRGARVDTGKFIASSLSIADSVFDKGLRNVTDGSAVFDAAGAGYLPTNRDSGVTVEAGAELRSAAGGDVLLLAPRVVNEGRIETPSGQTVLAAGQKVYLMSSSDPRQRGLIVAVDPFKVTGDNTTNDATLGIVTNAATGSYKTVDGATVDAATPDATTGLVTRINEIRAESGTVNLVGLSVRQQGVINATTAVKGANGAIHLKAMASTAALRAGAAEVFGSAGARGLTVEANSLVRVGAELGSMEIGTGSSTMVLPDAENRTQLDAEVFNPSHIRVEGRSIVVESGAQITAPAGRIELLAARDTIANPLFDSSATNLAASGDDSRIVMAPGARISAAGLTDVAVDGARNQGAQRLFRIELADAPVQRSGPLYRSEVFFDLRDGTKITAANVSGAAAAIGRTAQELSASGGSVRIEADGAVVLGGDALVDVSGGSTHYSQTVLDKTLVVRDGRVIAFSTANPELAIDELLTQRQRVVVPAYDEGQAGGELSISARQLALDSTLKGGVVQGERQRDGTSPRAAPAALKVGRSVGTSADLQQNYLRGIRLDAAPTTVVDAAFFADPLQGSLQALGSSAGVALPKLQASGFGSVALRADEIVQPVHGALNLGAGGRLDLQAARSIVLDGDFSAPGGSIVARTLFASANSATTGEGDIHLSGSTTLDAAGLWTNDTAATGTPGNSGLLQRDGGKISLLARHSLTVAPGASLDVSGGAWLNGSGAISKGRAGTLTLSAGPSDVSAVAMEIGGARLAGYDFSSGGTLSLTVPDLAVGAPGAGGFMLAPEFFSSGGFGTIAVHANGNIRVGSGAQVAPSLSNWELAPGFRSAASGPMRAEVAASALLDPQSAQRAPVNLSLSAERGPLFGGSSLRVERGASITLEPGGALKLSATRNLEVGARGGAPGQLSELTARGGSITLGIQGVRGSDSDASLDPAGFLGDQALWLGSGARLSVAGIAQLRPDVAAPSLSSFRGASAATPTAERVTGTVRGGGSITLAAQRGYVVAEAGSSMVLDGASAAVNFPGMPAAVTVAKPGGTLGISTPEGFVLDGSVSAQAPRDAAGRALADGGRLSVAVGVGGTQTGTQGPVAYPDNPVANQNPKARTVAIGAYDGLLATGGAVPGQDLTQALGNGTGYLSTSLLADAGFSRLGLGAGDAVRFDTGLALSMPLGIQIDAPAIAAAPGVQVRLDGASVQLGDQQAGRFGNRAPQRGALADASGTGSTRLAITAPLIELYGDWGLQGFSSVLLDAGATRDGEIRLSTVLPGLGSATLGFAGTLTLAAGQVYATSGTRYVLDGLEASSSQDPGSTLQVRKGPGGAAIRPPLSAFGAIEASATRILQNGVLHQPFGSITLKAERDLVLGTGSLTSASALGATIPYGVTSNLVDWRLPNGASADVLPRSKGILLSGGQVVTNPGAIVSASGGGTVQASEFFPGIGGSTDYFETPGLYAVLPDYSATQSLALTGGKLDAAQQGRRITITTPGSGLPPGTYTLLPARYALQGGSLPQGAFLVRRAADQGKVVLTKALRQDDGGVVVAGYLGEAGSVNVGTPGERFVVEPMASFRAKAEVRLTDISDLLANRAATLGEPTVPALPRDAGRVQVVASGSDPGRWQARLELQASGGLGGLLDMSATRLALVDDLAKTPSGALGVAADVLARSGAGSVLLGGLRSAATTQDRSLLTDAAGRTVWNIDQSATQAVTVDLGARALQVEELLLAATGSVTLAPRSRIDATAVATLGARTLASQGPGSLLAVSANALDLVRTDAQQAAGSLVIGAGSNLRGAQLGLDTTGVLQVDGTARLAAPALGIGARRIMVGQGAAADAGGSVLAGSLLAAVRDSDELALRAYQSIDFVGVQDWSQRTPADVPGHVAARLVLDAPVVRGLNAQDGTAARTDIAAHEVVLRNTSGAAPDPTLAGQGGLLLQALPLPRFGSTGGLALGEGSMALGFDGVALRSGGDIVLQGQGAKSAQQDITLSAARVTATTGADQSLAAAGTLRIAVETGSRTLGERVGQGARLQLSGATVVQQGVVDLAGGKLALRAQGTQAGAAAILFDAGSLTSVAGFTLPATDGFEVFGRAGSLQASATLGRIDVLGTLDAGAARRSDGSLGLGDAGSIVVSATGAGGALVLSGVSESGATVSGALQAHGGSGATDQGGRIIVDVAAMASADALAQAARAGGATGEFGLRVRSGNVSLAQDIRAAKIALSADAGALSLGAATLDAASPTGGVVRLSAGGTLTLGGAARIDARSLRAGANGGDVLLGSTADRVHLDAGALVDTRGDDAQDGRIVLRAQRGADNTSVKIDPLDTTRLLAGEVDLEAVRSYNTVTVGAVTRDITAIAAGASAIAGSGASSTGTLGQENVRSDSAGFMAARDGILAGLGIGAAEADRVHLRAGVEVRAPGNLAVTGDWQLAADRPGADAGFLTLRAAGNLALNGSLSDGFSTTTAAGVLNGNERSWSMRLAAGADLSAADPLAVRDLQGALTGDLLVSANRLVRTGAGSIEMAAGRDIVFQGSGATQSTAYVAGRRMAGQEELLSELFAGQGAKPGFTEHGGRLTLEAQRNITSLEATQLVNNWLWRSGIPIGDSYSASSQLAWWTEFGSFRQTLGSFGGGDLSMRAGGDIVNLQAMAPTSGWADSKTIAQAALQVRNGGDVRVSAGGDIVAGQFLVGRGEGQLRAEGGVVEAAGNARAKSTLLALMDGTWDVAAREDLTVGGVFNPTAVPVSGADNRANFSSFFYTWGSGASVGLNATAGSARLTSDMTEGSNIQNYGLGTAQIPSPRSLFQVMPASLRITAASGDAQFFRDGAGGAMLFPAADGALEVWSGGNLTLFNSLAMADSSAALWPGFATPLTRQDIGQLAGTGNNGLIPGTLAGVLANSSLHASDDAPVRLHAEGSVKTVVGSLVLPKAAEINAGQDIVGLVLNGQNLHPSDKTLVRAGRNFLAGQFGDITLAGPGALEVAAGRQVDLGNSQGISTIGNTRNAALPALGASVTLMAAQTGVLDPSAFAAAYLDPASAIGATRVQLYRDMLRDAVRAALRLPNLGFDEAWSYFLKYPQQAQASFAGQVVAQQFAATYLTSPIPDIAQMEATLRTAFAQRKADILQAGDAALAAAGSLTLPGREVVEGAALAAYLAELRSLSFDDIDTAAVVRKRVENLAQVQLGWREAVAASQGGSVAALVVQAAQEPGAPAVLAYQAALEDFSGRHFDDYRLRVLSSETASAGAAAAQFGRKSLPLRLALFDQGFAAAELAGFGSFSAQPLWPGVQPVFAYTGTMNLTQSSVVTERGGGIGLVNPGGAINVGLKDLGSSDTSSPKGVITLGGGDIFGYAKGDFQVNTQRVFVVGQGDMNIWSSAGDIDSGRGANTAVAAPPLAARRSVDGVAFELPATTTGSGLGILEDTAGVRSGTIGLYPALGEILALDAFIRAPSVVLGSTIRGADNLQAVSVGGATATVAAPTLAAPSAPTSNATRTAEASAAGGTQSQQEARPRNALLTVDLLGLGPAPTEEECQRAQGRGADCAARPGGEPAPP